MSKSRPILFFLTMLLTFSLSGCGKIDEYASRDDVFYATFGKAPPSSVTELQGYGNSYSSSTCYLRFKASFEETYMLAGHSFNPISHTTFASDVGSGFANPSAPWWTPPLVATTKCYMSTVFHPTYSQGRAYLAYDTVNGVAYFYWTGLD